MNKNRDLTKKEPILGERPSPGKETIAEFLEALSSKSPIPSGGGVTALSTSLAFSLALMVGNLTLGKKKYAHYEERLKIRMEEKEIYRERMEECLDHASYVPLQLLKLCAETAKSLKELAEEGSKLAISDVGIAAGLFLTAMRGSALNVRINTNLMQNEERKKEREEAVEEALKQCELLEQTVREVEKRI